MANQTPSKQIYDVLVSKNFDPQLLNKDGMPAQDPADADVFSFDWVAKSGKDYGTVVIMFGDEHDMTIYFGDNVGKSMEGDDKKEWFDFLYQLRMLAKRNLQSFSIQNLNKLKYNMKSMSTAVKEGLFESWVGTRTHSWNAKPTEARLMVKHSKIIGEGDARYRYVESLFIETTEGERFKLPFTKISAGKAMLEHVKQGGKPYDARGNHITQIVNEMNVLSRFYKANKNVITEDEAEQQLIEEVAQYHANLKSQLGKISSKRGYTNYFETWNPEITTEQDMVIEGIRTLFATESGERRIERALPALAKIKTQGNAMKEIGIFEGWMACLAEGTWSLPDTPEKQQKLITLLSKELPVGPDATDVTEQLYDILGDDELFDQLESLAKEDANADARTIIINRLEQMASNPAVAQVIGKLKIEQKPADEPAVEQEPVQEEVNVGTYTVWVGGVPEAESVSHKEALAIAKEFMNDGYDDVQIEADDVNEENIDEQIQRISELSSGTLKNYIKKASSSSDERSASNLASRAADKLHTGDQDDAEWDDGSDDDHKSYMRSKGIARAVDKLEEVTDEVKLDAKTGKPVAWSHEGDWEKIKKRAGKEVDARGEVTNMVGKELKKASSLKEGLSIADYKKKIAAMPDAEVKSLLTVMVGHNRDNPWDQGIIKLLKREIDNRSEQLDEIGDTAQGKKALGKYVKAAASNRAMRTFDQGFDANDDIVFDKVNDRKQANRGMGISRAVDRLVREDEETSPVESAILRRIMGAHLDLLEKYGPEAVMDAARGEAEFVGDVDEIGTSDVSAWVEHVVWDLEHTRKPKADEGRDYPHPHTIKNDERVAPKYFGEDSDKIVNMTMWMNKFDEREDINDHSTNLLAVAKLVGTPEDVAQAKELLRIRDTQGGLGDEEAQAQYKMYKRLWPLVQKKEFDWNERANAKIADEGMIGKMVGTLAGDALGGPVAGAIGGMAGDALQDKLTNEGTSLQGQYGHAGKMAPVKAEHFGDKFAEDIARLKALALIK